MSKLLRIAALLCTCFAAACTTAPPAVTANADCNLPDVLQQTEVVTPLPEDHDLSPAEMAELLKDHMLHEKDVSSRSNAKTAFVNSNCRPGAAALPTTTIPATSDEPAAPAKPSPDPSLLDKAKSLVPSWL